MERMELKDVDVADLKVRRNGALRVALAGLLGLVTTLGLFYLMQALIAGADASIKEDTIGALVDWVRVKEPPDVLTKRQVRPPEPEVAPEEPPPKDFPVVQQSAEVEMGGIAVNTDLNSASIDGEYLPIVKVQPQYPRRALTRGIAGWVIVRFTVTAQGTVESPVVVENCGWVQNSSNREEDCYDSPNSIFDAAAKKAALKFKYKPKVRDGQPVATSGVLHQITFELQDEGGRR